MKGALLVLGVLVLVSITEASYSSRQAKNPFTIWNRNRLLKDPVTPSRRVTADTLCACSEPCVREYVLAYHACIDSEDLDTYVSCMGSNFSDNCHSSILEYVSPSNGEISC